ncbi:MAG: ABC transporter substrate-binding protein [Clostridia bacterium]|nr:ABC transporter substrate-binding protein [Clostridia bacterium]
MTKRIIALLLSIICVALCFVGCHDKNIDGEVIQGAEIKMYLSDMVYDLDPALCLDNDAAMQVCGLLYDTLFSLDSDGKVQKSIVDSYEIKKDEQRQEYTMLITLKDDNCWSDGTYVSAEDVIYSWKRILDQDFNSTAACLLYDIKNAKEAKQGDCSIDDVGIYAVDELVIQVTFVGDIDYDNFILNLTSVALAPLREDVVKKLADWSKKPATTVCSGPFMLRRVHYGLNSEGREDLSMAELILERNPYYRRAKDAKYIDTSVTPFRLIVDFSKTAEEQLDMFNNGEIFYVGNIALSKRAEYADKAKVTDLLSTHTYFLNENADIETKDGKTAKLFANKDVRLALSAAIDRNAIAEKVVFARAASALVPYGVFEAGNRKELFRDKGGDIISTSKDMSKAQSYLASAGITPSDYTFKISVRADNEVHVAVAETVCESWKELGFNVSVETVKPIVNPDPYLGEDAKDIYDDEINSRYYNNNYEVIAVDMQSYSPDAFSTLAPFAKLYSGQSIFKEMNEETHEWTYTLRGHKTGYDSETYNALIAKVDAASDKNERASLLHDAEKALLEDMPVIPVVFNQNAYLISADLSRVKSSYYGFRVFTSAKLKNYLDYIVTEAPETVEEPSA